MCLTGVLSTDQGAVLKIFFQERSSEDGSIRTATPSMVKSMTEMSGISKMALKEARFYAGS